MMTLFIGYYMGFMSMVAIYNLHWYVITRDKSYLYYSIFKSLIAVTVVIAYISASYDLYFYAIVTALLIFIILFTQELLELKKTHPLTYNVLNAVILLLILELIICIYIDDYSIFVQPYSLVIAPLVVIGISAHIQGNETAKYFVVSWAVGVILVGIYDLNQYNIINFYPDFPFDHIGGILESVLLSYAIFIKTLLCSSFSLYMLRVLINMA